MIIKNIKHILILLVISFITSCSSPKTTPELLNNYCKKLSFSSLIQELKALQKKDTFHKYKFGSIQERDIIGNYKENLFVFRKFIKQKESIGDSYVFKLIIKDSLIISCEIFDIIYDYEIVGYPFNSNDLLFVNTNVEEKNKLKIKFEKIFKKKLNFNELFQTDSYFGINCGGISSRPTSEILKISELIDKKNANGIENWLQSSSTEKQLYGLIGYYKLRDSVKFRKYVPKIVKAIEMKTGKYSSCSGCTRNIAGSNIQEEIKKIKNNKYSLDFDYWYNRFDTN